jgi:hypothetical protein
MADKNGYTCFVMSFFEKILYYQKRNRLLSHLLFWLTVLFISMYISKYRDGSEFTYRFALIGNGLYLVPQIIASYFLTYWVGPQFFFRKKYLSGLVGFILGSYLICVLSRFLIVKVAEPLAGIAPNAFETNLEILTDLPKLLCNYFFSIFSLALAFMFVKLLKDQMEIQKRALTLEKQKAEAELKLLKSQLNPHFLFNTLNNIYSLSLSNSPVTSTSIGRLSEILDYILYHCNSLYVPLSGEIMLLNNYIGLEKLRYDERLKVDFKCNADQNIEIAPLILLSIVENAFKHGAGNDIGEPVIRIELNADEKLFSFKVVNSFQPKNPVSQGSIGLPNLKQQLELIYPQKHKLEITQTDTLFTVTLAIYLS